MYEASSNDAPSDTDTLRSLESSGALLGWGLGLAGMAWAASRLLERLAAGLPTASVVAAAALEGLAFAILAALVGWAVGISGRIASTFTPSRPARPSRSDEDLAALAGRAVAAIERLVDAMERRPATGPAPDDPKPDRSRRLLEIDQALRTGRPEDAGSLIDELALRFPDDEAIPGLRDRLDAARRQGFEGMLAQIQAARQVNDPARVLELYRGLQPPPDYDRGDLDRDLARWFLQLIQRRLWGRRIQPEVVELAATVAETFSATVEGASLRASLPTLRRSVGLCPRCAQPYTGTAEACPQCLAGAVATAEETPPEPGPESDRADLPDDAPEAPGGDGDSGWMFYEEGDTDDASPPA